MGRFEGQVAMVTGGARGMGGAHARALAREGADGALLDMGRDLGTVGYPLAREEDLQETADLVAEEGRRVWTHRVDVRDFAAVESAVAETLSESGRLDIVVANAGVSAGDAVQIAAPDQWRDVIDTNLTGVFHTFRAAAPVMIPARR